MTCSAICPEPKTFRYLHVFQRGDLPIYVFNATGPVVPERIVFTVYFVRPGGALKQVGPPRRTPVAGMEGEFYATGRAGESDQPGCWMIRWEFQRTLSEAVQTKDMYFQVLDAVLANDPRDTTPRCRKYGWN
jgi:hypothetical protein